MKIMSQAKTKVSERGGPLKHREPMPAGSLVKDKPISLIRYVMLFNYCAGWLGCSGTSKIMIITNQDNEDNLCERSVGACKLCGPRSVPGLMRCYHVAMLVSSVSIVVVVLGRINNDGVI